MSRKTLLVLAASLYQLPVIHEARRQGLRVITADNVPENPGHRLADASYDIDTRDRDAILRMAEAEQIDGVIAACTDVALPTAAYVAERLDLCAPPLEAVEIACDKAAFRRWQTAQGLPSPTAFEARRPEDIDAGLFANERWILKPDKASGSKGVFIVSNWREMAGRFNASAIHSPDGRVVLERYLEGVQLTCEGVLRKGALIAAWILDRQTAAPYTTTAAHFLPTRLAPPDEHRVLQAVQTAWERLGVQDGPFDADLVLTPEAAYILEMSPRLGGNSIAALLKESAGFDLMEFAVRWTCDASPEVSQKRAKPAAILLLGLEQGGRLCFNVTEAAALAAEPWVKYLQLDRHAGELVEPFINSRHRVGEALITAPTREELESRAEQFLARLQLGSE